MRSGQIRAGQDMKMAGQDRIGHGRAFRACRAVKAVKAARAITVLRTVPAVTAVRKSSNGSQGRAGHNTEVYTLFSKGGQKLSK